jgi:hypothetical protein
MPKYRPYQFWTLEEIERMLLRQLDFYEYSVIEKQLFWQMTYDPAWNPRWDFDGCTFIQDTYHPYGPCFRHDYNCKVMGGAYWAHELFYKDLVRFDTPKYKAFIIATFAGLGWILWKKHTRRNKKIRNTKRDGVKR